MSNQRKTGTGRAQTLPYPSYPPPPPWTPQLRLRLARGEAGLSQSDLAAKLGLERKTISNWERGDTLFENIRYRWLVDAARELAVTAEWLLTGDGSTPRPERPTATIHDMPTRQPLVRRSAVTGAVTRRYIGSPDQATCAA